MTCTIVNKIVLVYAWYAIAFARLKPPEEVVITMRDSNLTDRLQWTTEAQIKLKKIPFFVRSQAISRIEQLTRSQGLDIVTAEIVEQARLEFGQ